MLYHLSSSRRHPSSYLEKYRVRWAKSDMVTNVDELSFHRTGTVASVAANVLSECMGRNESKKCDRHDYLNTVVQKVGGLSASNI
jgi:hypothetical protein